MFLRQFWLKSLTRRRTNFYYLNLILRYKGNLSKSKTHLKQANAFEISLTATTHTLILFHKAGLRKQSLEIPNRYFVKKVLKDISIWLCISLSYVLNKFGEILCFMVQFSSFALFFVTWANKPLFPKVI